MRPSPLKKRVSSGLTVKRYVAKTISWGITGSVGIALLVWMVSGELVADLTTGLSYFAANMVLFFVHERLWHRLKFGARSRRDRAEKVRKDNSETLFSQPAKIGRKHREGKNPAITIWLTGLSCSGKSTIAAEIDHILYLEGERTYIMDGDNTRIGINYDLSFSHEDRIENIRRVGEICKLFNEAGVTVIASFISPTTESRELARKIIGAESFIEVHVDAHLETCKERDIKGLYKLAAEGKIKNFTGIDSVYEIPSSPHLRVDTNVKSVNECVNEIVEYLKFRNLKSPHYSAQATE